VPDFAATGQAVAEIWRLFDFQDGGHRRLGFLNFRKFKAQKGVKMRRRAKFCGGQSQSTVAEIWRFFDFKDGGCPPCWIFKTWEF